MKQDPNFPTLALHIPNLEEVAVGCITGEGRINKEGGEGTGSPSEDSFWTRYSYTLYIL